MCGTDWLSRIEFFENVRQEYEKMIKEPSTMSNNSSAILLDLRKKFPNIFDGSHYPKLVIAIDNAEELKWHFNAEHSWSDVVCDIVSRYSLAFRESVWVVFSSRDQAVAEYNIGYVPYIRSSLRIAVPGNDIYPPFTLLGWDQFAPPYGTYPTRDVAKLRHLVQFGRPLWKHLMTECGTYSALLEKSTSYMLRSTGSFDPTNHVQALALLSQRFCIQMTSAHPLANHFIAATVSQHLCTCIERADNGTWIHGAYPSEPFLSHVVASILHRPGEDDALLRSLEILLRYASSRVIVAEPHGDLVSRLLWMLCKDFLVRDLSMSQISSDQTLDIELPFCKMLPLAALLESMFGSRMWPRGSPGNAAKDALKNAYVNMSHWARVGEDTARSPEKRSRRALRLWARTAGAQCHLQQVPVRQIVPIWYDAPEASATLKGTASSTDSPYMGHILICSRISEDPTPSSLFDSVTPERYGLEGNMPYVVILLDLGCRTTAIHSAFESNLNAPRLTIHATGMCRETFPFLDRLDRLEQLMKDITELQTVSRPPISFVDDLNDSLLFGSTVESSHMNWERQGYTYDPHGVVVSI
ncbi:hypothetical protein CERSUDRAFT_96757 [Gelatoporia subvermispora B]|uniref:Uncharacterized protein n=1 Tax=Ceriporiopsis subvermispora (strain B) TaxID=914234 RepID=M2PHS6_CERS8|nr:hypothetical protein CERSUDRAFT_96757 [Gelatoporia subvermispora B]